MYSAPPSRATTTLWLCDPALRFYGSALSIANALTAFYWLVGQPAAQILDRGEPPICWPFFDRCAATRMWSSHSYSVLFVAITLLSLANAIGFVGPSTARWALTMLTAITCIVGGVVGLDYRLALNQHYMHFSVFAVFLLIRTRLALKIMLSLFYICAGLLKLNASWLSGAALYGARPLGLPETWIPYACCYVVVIELGWSWCLLARQRLLFWIAFGQIVAFHVSSFWVVGFFYPLLMALLLSIFALDRVFVEEEPSRDIRRSHSVLERVEISFAVGVFAILQTVPRIVSPDLRVIRFSGRFSYAA